MASTPKYLFRVGVGDEDSNVANYDVFLDFGFFSGQQENPGQVQTQIERFQKCVCMAVSDTKLVGIGLFRLIVDIYLRELYKALA